MSVKRLVNMIINKSIILAVVNLHTINTCLHLDLVPCFRYSDSFYTIQIRARTSSGYHDISSNCKKKEIRLKTKFKGTSLIPNAIQNLQNIVVTYLRVDWCSTLSILAPLFNNRISTITVYPKHDAILNGLAPESNKNKTL